MKRVLGEGWILPALDNLNRAFFTTGKLTLQQCKKCSHLQHPPEEICRNCQSFDLGHFESAGTGKIASVAVNHHPVHPDMRDIVPFAIVLVAVDDAPGPLLAGNAIGVAPTDVQIGDSVRVVFEEAHDKHTDERLLIPQWEVVR